MPLLGPAAMLLSFDVDADAVEEHDRWHTQEHLPERLSIPGFLRGTRWVASAGAPRYMVLYEVQSLATLASKAYLARLNQPTPWTTAMMPHYRAMRRGLCAVLGSFGHGLGGTAALVRFGADDSSAGRLHRWLLDEALPAAARTAGLGSAHLLQGARAAAMTNEQRIRGQDGGIDTVIVVTGYDDAAVAAFAGDLCAGDAIPGRGGSEVSSAVYRWSYSVASAEMADPSPAATAPRPAPSAQRT